MDSVLDAYLSDPGVSEILVNGPENIWVERNGNLTRENARFSSGEELERWARCLVGEAGRRIDRRNPYVDSRLSDGSRLCVMIDPVVRGGVHLSIRRFPKKRPDLSELTESGMVSEKATAFLRSAVLERRNIFVSGATGAGKTTLLNALVEEIPANERIITIEDTQELKADHPHVIGFQARPANTEGEGEIDIRTLLRCALRMRPDRLVMGECRGREAIDLVQALNTGHRGSMGTIHANSPRDALARLELLCLMELPNVNAQAMKSYLQSAIQVLVHVEKVENARRVVAVQELSGLEGAVFLLKKRDI
jgi:pilus assembly protein CpaF